MIGTSRSTTRNSGRNQRIARAAFFVIVLVVFAVAQTHAQEASLDWSEWTDSQKEEFLQNAEILTRSEIGIGITQSERATLQSGEFIHDAHIQDIDESRAVVNVPGGVNELNFRDSYKFNVAAYRLDRLINLNVVPVSVPRRIDRETCSVTWWIDDVQMMERERRDQGLEPPSPVAWAQQIYNVRIFQELVYNTDPNMGNILITDDWQIRLIDFSRAFRRHKNLRNPDSFTPVVHRRVYEGLKALERKSLEEAMDGLLMNVEIEGILARRDAIVERLDAAIAEKGAGAVLFGLASSGS